MSKWIMDAGHGGNDSGIVAKGNVEKVYTLEAALYVGKRLKEHGIDTDYSRTKDTTLDPGPRTKIVKKYHRCISHHFNGGGGDGLETIHSVQADGKFEHMIVDEFKRAGYPVRLRPVYFKTNKDGKTNYYYMHRETGNCKTTIVEYDFADGPQSEKIKNKSYREGMYECVVRAICKLERKEYKPLRKDEPPKNIEVESFAKYPILIRAKEDTKGYEYPNLSGKSTNYRKGIELHAYGQTSTVWAGGGGVYFSKNYFDVLPQTVVTGGLSASRVDQVEKYFRDNKTAGSVEFVGAGNPYAQATLKGLNLVGFCQWLDEQKWWYQVK